MANRPAIVTQGEATKLFKAARAGGFDRARVVCRPDGTVEVIAEMAGPVAPSDPLEAWRAANGAG